MSVSAFQPRTHWQVTWSVWQALFVREFLTRVAADRLAWFWMLFEPIAMIAIMVAMRAVVLGQNQYIAGAPFLPWVLLGLLSFFLFRENMLRAIGSIESSQSLFIYRQVKPVDPVLVRCFLEGVLKTFILMLFTLAGVLLAMPLFPVDFYAALFAWISIWLLGIGTALALSATSRLVPEVGKVARILALPLLLVSGAIIPLGYLPHDVLRYLMWNPIVHGIEILRDGFFSNYRPLEGTDPLYLWLWILSLILIGLAMHLRFEPQLKAQ